MFVVLPHLSSRPAIFGIYSLCMSMSIFVAYADFGFVGAGFRYASQSFVAGDLQRETRIVGFVSFVLLVFVLLHSAVVLVFAVRPGWLIVNLTDPVEAATASALLATMAVSSPVIVLQRMLQIIFGVRIEDYIYQRLTIAGNLLKVASVYLFINASGYNIVGYFVGCQVIALASCCGSLWLARQRYEYDLLLLFRSIRFSRIIFDATKRLAFSSLYVTIAWVTYYEFDTLFIGRMLGAESLAIYAVALSLSQSFRTLSSVVFAPFRARINHFVALGDDIRLRALYLRVMVITLPAAVFPVVSLLVLMQPFILSWVGDHYLLSTLIAQLLILQFIDGFSGNPASYLLTAQERVRELYLVGTAAPVVLWASVLLTLRVLDVTLFAALKAAAAMPALIFNFVISCRLLKDGPVGVFYGVVWPAVLPIAGLVGLLLVIRPYLPAEKSHMNLAIVIVTGGAASMVASMLYFATSREFRMTVTPIVQRYVMRRKPLQTAEAASEPHS